MNKLKIIVLGAQGMAGHVIYNMLLKREDCITIGLDRSSLSKMPLIKMDVTNFDELHDLIKNEKPAVIINAIGILIRGSEDSPSNAILLNSYLPNFLKDLCDQYKAKLIHISTDCVFSGKAGPYLEDDFCDANDIYGRSKALGEIRNDRDITIRTSIIGPELKQNGEGLFDWFMNQSGVIKGFSKVYWSGVTTFQLAEVISACLQEKASGLYHLTNNRKISKYELLMLLGKAFNKRDIKIVPDDTINKDKSFIDSRRQLMFNVPGYDKMLKGLREYMLTKDYYSKYFV